MQFLALTLTTLLTCTTAQSFYDFAIYTDAECSIFAGGIDGETSQGCTALPASSGSNIWLESDGYSGTCEINIYSDSGCLDQVSGTTTPPNLGCVSANGGQYYTVSDC